MKKQYKPILICFCGLILTFFMNCASISIDANTETAIYTKTETGTSAPLFTGSGDIGGILTVTDIPSDYNGKYAYFTAYLNNNTYIRGYQSKNESTQITTISQILNGSVGIPLWLCKSNEAVSSYYSETGYTGSDTILRSQEYFDPCVFILGGGEFGPLIDPLPLARIEFTSITFSNGSATLSANRGTLKIAQQ
jgi:hypothetical protein